MLEMKTTKTLMWKPGPYTMMPIMERLFKYFESEYLRFNLDTVTHLSYGTIRILKTLEVFITLPHKRYQRRFAKVQGAKNRCC